jgi:hypothetical protein
MNAFVISVMKRIILITAGCCIAWFINAQQQNLINRQDVVRRHNITVTKADPLSSLSVGNGQFAYTVDVTGMQSFPEFYQEGVPLGTQSAWGWHSSPNPARYQFEETMKVYEFDGRKISYPVQWQEPERNKQAADYFRMSPHRLQLGNIGLEITKKDGSLAGINDIKNIRQRLDIWTGEIRSSFTMEGEPVEVFTYVHQERDIIAVRIKSPLLKKNRLAIRLRFPYPSGEFKDAGTNYKAQGLHSSFIRKAIANEAIIYRVLDTVRYFVNAHWQQKALLELKSPHYFLIKPARASSVFEASFQFSPSLPNLVAHSFPQTRTSSSRGWIEFWKSGGAVDFAGSKDKRAFELERRIILSQYLTKLQCDSPFPPQETGLTFNSWYGKPHLEMHWWHAVHFALWGRTELMEKSLDWYFKAAPSAKAIAQRQGFDGVRWQKMTDHKGNESPSSIGSFLVWQQPHFIYMTELLYRTKDGDRKKIINKYKDLVFATADFMASFLFYDPVTKKYNLGKGLIPAQERFDPETTFNPAYELAYWHWALSIAQQWRTRSGMTRNAKWDEVLANLAPLPQKNKVYLVTESEPDCYVTEQYLTDHPAVLGAYASIPAANNLDTSVMRNTFDLVWKIWHWNDTWGWDFPLTAMTATRLNIPGKAIDALLMPVQKNTYLPNGHNYQDERLTIYLPGNGGLLAAVAMMCAGYDNNRVKQPGIPRDGNWKVRWEGLKQIF